MEIQEKNVEPTVEKKVSSEKDGTYNQSNFANIGDKVYFKTVITAQAGAQKYVLHDTMSEGLTFNNDIEIRLNDESGTPIGADNYTIKLNPSVTNATNVENKSGSLLPSTGGMGTTIFYIAGAFLVLISGVVLIAKKRTDSK